MYLELALVGDVTTVTQVGIEYLETVIPGFTARAGNVETVMVESSGQMMGELMEQASIVPSEAFAALGTSIFAIPMTEGQQSFGAAVITWAVDTPASTFPADSEVAVPNPDGNMYVFTTDRDLVAISGGGTESFNLIARDVGFDMNGSFGVCQMIDEVEGVASIVIDVPTASGADDESAEAYLDRLTTTIALLAPRPILPEDHAAMASTVPGVGRASVMNLYYPGTPARDNGTAIGDFDMPLPPKTPPYDPAVPATNIPRCTTVCIMSDDYTEPDAALMQSVFEMLDRNREVNFLNFVMKPTFVSVDLRAVLTPYPNNTKQEAIDSSTQMVNEWLSPQQYGIPPKAGKETPWATDTLLRLYEAVDFLNRGVATWYVENVQMKLSSEADSAWRAADVVLTGVFPIPTIGQLILT